MWQIHGGLPDVRDDTKRGKLLLFKQLAEREGFEPSIQVLARITV
jgi:hypothetical protein